MPEVWHILEQSAALLTLELYERALGAIVQHMPVDPAKTRRLSVNVPLELAEKVEALAAKDLAEYNQELMARQVQRAQSKAELVDRLVAWAYLAYQRGHDDLEGLEAWMLTDAQRVVLPAPSARIAGKDGKSSSLMKRHSASSIPG